MWLWGTYKHPPAGLDLRITDALIAVTIAAALLGVLRLIQTRDYPLGAWLALSLVVWLGLSAYSTTWVDAKTLMLTTPVFVLLAWSGVSALRTSPLARAAPLLALALTAGVIASDALQYHSSNLAPTARYQELASIDHRFAGKGPTLFTDFDEYALYELRDLDVGGANFGYSPPALSHAGTTYRYPVVFDRLPPAVLRSYPLIVTRRDPAAERPPSAYRLLWQGTYYQVWGRTAGTPAAIAVVGLSGSLPDQCARIEHLARTAAAGRARLIAAPSPVLVRLPLAQAPKPAGWARIRGGLEMREPGALHRRIHGAPGRHVGYMATGPGDAQGHCRRGRASAGVAWRAARRQLGGYRTPSRRYTPPSPRAGIDCRWSVEASRSIPATVALPISTASS